MSTQQDLRKLKANMDRVAKSLVPKAAAATINKLTKKAMKEATGKVAKDIGVPAKTIRPRAQNPEKATARSPKAKIRVNRSNMPAFRLFENRSNKMWVGRGGIVIGKYCHKIVLEGELIIEPPTAAKRYQIELTEDELQSLTWAWFALLRGVHTFQHIYPSFEKLRSSMSGMIYGQAFEYRTTVRDAQKIINRLTNDIPLDYSTNWRVLKHVREFDPTFKLSII